MNLFLLPDRYALLRLDPAAPIPPLPSSGFISITRTEEELSIVCRSIDAPRAEKLEDGWSLLKIEGPLDLGTPGILASLLAPLASAAIPIFAISTYDTDYALVREVRVDEAIRTLEQSGHSVLPV